MSSGVIVRVARIQLSILRRSQNQVRVERSVQSNEEPKQQIDKLADDITLSKSQEVHIKAILTYLPVRMIKTGCMEAYSI